MFLNVRMRDKYSRDIIWTSEHESILVDWADKAMCYNWLHSKSNIKYSRLNSWFTIPVIIMSTLTGTANFAQERLPESSRKYAPIIIGSVNIIAGIITTIQQFFKISDINEAHRVSSISWDKFYRKIKVELSKSPVERQNVYEFLKNCTEEFDRLMEVSPSIDQSILNQFEYSFSKKKGLAEETIRMFSELKKPEICDSLESVKYAVYQPSESIKKERLFKNLIDDIKISQSEQGDNTKKKLIEEFRLNFKKELLREPTFEEYKNNLVKVELGITEGLLSDFIKEYSSKSDIQENVPVQESNLELKEV